MDPQPLFCPIETCPSRGVMGAGNLRPHASLHQRWKCLVCGKTFSGRKGTPFYRLKTDPQIVVWVLSLLAHGCSVQAIVATFHLDERTVADWQQRAGAHCQRVAEALVEQPHDLEYVQADEIRVRAQKRAVLWMAMAIGVTTRLWLGGVISAQRDKHLARSIAKLVRRCAKLCALLVATDGWSAYADAFAKAFRLQKRSGKRGQPPLIAWPQFVLVQTVKWEQAGRVLGIRVCHLFGAITQIASRVPKCQVVNTAYIERLNATFRQRLAGLCRRTRCLLRQKERLHAGMYLVGTVYNFCTPHKTLTKQKGTYTTPAMAAGLAHTIWSVGDLLCYQIAPPPFVRPKPKSNRGRPKGSKNKPKMLAKVAQ